MEYRASRAKGTTSDGNKEASTSKPTKKGVNLSLSSIPWSIDIFQRRHLQKRCLLRSPRHSQVRQLRTARPVPRPRTTLHWWTFSRPSKSNSPRCLTHSQTGTIFSSLTPVDIQYETSLCSPSTTYFQQQAAHNPFMPRQSMLMTGAYPPQQVFVPSQPTGFVQPQHTAMPNMPFQHGNNTFTQQQQAPPHFPFLQTQPTGFLQPQTTGSNPFRQSMLLPQSTGMPIFGGNAGSGGGGQAQPFPISQQAINTPTSPFGQPTPVAFGNMGLASTAPQNIPARPASTPITSNTSNSFGQAMQPVVSHATGSRNPFGVPQEPAPPVPKAPTLAELKTGLLGNFNSPGGVYGTNPMQQQAQGQQAHASTSGSPPTMFPFSSSTGIGGAAGQDPKPSEASSMSGIASSFSFNNNWSMDSNKRQEAASTTSSAFSSQPTGSTVSALLSQPTGATNYAFSTFSSQPTGSTSATSAPSLQPQTTGFSGLKAFKPTSSFGASLLESLPTIPQADESSGGNADRPTTSGLPFQSSLPSSPSTSTSFSGATNSNPAPQFPFLNSQPTGVPNFSALGSAGSTATNSTSTLGVGLRPQLTGGGMAANPFRASMFTSSVPGGGGLPAFGGSATTGTTGNGNMNPQLSGLFAAKQGS